MFQQLQLPADLDPKRRAVIETAFLLVGKVNYFWGGKSPALGWNSNWGTLQKVTAEGSKTTGTMRVYGLDCSGFVSWTFINAKQNTNIYAYIGEGASTQYSKCTQISWSEAQIGDLVFYPDLSHIGIICGIDEDGDFAIVHENSTDDNIAISGIRGFTLVGKPQAYNNF